VVVAGVSDPRFDRQVRFADLGAAGQARLQAASALVVGCGALGGSIAMQLTRSGIGRLTLVDRDVVELSNLPRQVLFHEEHLGAPKALCARDELARIGGPTKLEAHAEHLDADNLAQLARGVDIVLDGTDNLATRYLVNDYCVEKNVPWVYGGVVGAAGLVMPITPGASACLRCVFPEPPPAGALPTCDTAGVILPAVAAIASLQCAAALRILATPRERWAELEPRLIEVDVWNLEARSIRVSRDPECRCCGAREFEFLDAPAEGLAISLCGRNTVQVRPAAGRQPTDLPALAERLRASVRDLALQEGLLVFAAEGKRFTVFRDGRALIEGLDDAVRARALYDRFLGS
jgi:molybdopterin/thiamine biosynthesis adenylyltransferase